MKVIHCCFYDNISYKCSWNHLDIATNKKHLATYVHGKWLKTSNQGWTHWLVEHELCHLPAGRNQMHYTCVPKKELKTQEVFFWEKKKKRLETKKLDSHNGLSIKTVRNTGRLYCISLMRKYTSVPYIGGISVRYK